MTTSETLLLVMSVVVLLMGIVVAVMLWQSLLTIFAAVVLTCATAQGAWAQGQFGDLPKTVSASDVEVTEVNEQAMFVTMFICRLNLKSRLLEYCNAGHNPPARLLEFLQSAHFHGAQQMIEMLRDEVEKHRNGAEPNDDLTMMCLQLV